KQERHTKDLKALHTLLVSILTNTLTTVSYQSQIRLKSYLRVWNFQLKRTGQPLKRKL
ncbi:hypothetical protein, partial [Bacillus phage SPG24]